jgi:hypothetical protein
MAKPFMLLRYLSLEPARDRCSIFPYLLPHIDQLADKAVVALAGGSVLVQLVLGALPDGDGGVVFVDVTNHDLE